MTGRRVGGRRASPHIGVVMALRVAILCVLALTLQLTVFSKVRVAGVAPELLALVAAMSGLTVGSRHGSLIAFFAGLLWDVYLATPLGLSAASFALVAHAVGSVEEGLFASTRLQAAVLVMTATAAALTLYALSGELVGQDGLLGSGLAQTILLASAWNALLSTPAAPLVRWALTSRPADRDAG